MRKHLYTIKLLLSMTAIFSACDKDKNVPDDCYANRETIRVLSNKTAMVNWNGSYGYLTEEFTYDTKLYPCNLPKEFQVDKLVVKVSGDVKDLPEQDGSPCCSEGLDIKDISVKVE